jgi:hypothetical protein
MVNSLIPYLIYNNIFIFYQQLFSFADVKNACLGPDLWDSAYCSAKEDIISLNSPFTEKEL